MVIVFHLELIKSEFGLKNNYIILNVGGDMGVTLFFVLSGFLITYLLLEEKKITSKISLKNFYIRRILRIWPLYFFIVLLSIFILPKIGLMYEPSYHLAYIKNRTIIIFLYLFFGGNVLTVLYSHVNFLRPTWSVSVEEQFYFLWPILLKFSRNVSKTIRNVFLSYWLLRILFCLASCLSKGHIFYSRIFDLIQSILYQTPFDSLSIGALAAYVFWTKNSIIMNFLFYKKTQLLVFISLPFLLYVARLQAHFDLLTGEISCQNLSFALLFATAILNLAGNPGVIIALENKVLHYLGKISYGMYLYHWASIIIVINFLDHFKIFVSNILIFNIVLYLLSFGLTLLIAHVSYTYFEYKFIQLKSKFSSITSGDLVKNEDDWPQN